MSSFLQIYLTAFVQVIIINNNDNNNNNNDNSNNNNNGNPAENSRRMRVALETAREVSRASIWRYSCFCSCVLCFWFCACVRGSVSVSVSLSVFLLLIHTFSLQAEQFRDNSLLDSSYYSSRHCFAGECE